jgi:tetratricopeptide (TPR) repeat protein
VTAFLIALSISLTSQAAEPIQLPKLDPPTRTAPAMTGAEMTALKAGFALFQQKKYDEAIAAYQEILKGNPDALGATYEIALTYATKGDQRKAIDVALPLLQYQSPDLDKYYALVGSMLDDLKSPKDAVTVYEAGIVAVPKGGTLYFNEAVTELDSLNDPAAGLATLKRGAIADPSHAGIQFLLAGLFGKRDFKTPELLALSRFLILEPAGARAVSGYKAWYGLLTSNVTTGRDGKPQISMNPNKTTDEGNLTQLDLQIAMSQIATGNSQQTAIENLVAQWTGLLGVWGKYDGKDDADKMLWTYYMPYFSGLRDQKLVEPFVYVVSQKVGFPGAAAWVAAHQDAVQAFLAWNKAYAWPTPR